MWGGQILCGEFGTGRKTQPVLPPPFRIFPSRTSHPPIPISRATAPRNNITSGVVLTMTESITLLQIPRIVRRRARRSLCPQGTSRMQMTRWILISGGMGPRSGIIVGENSTTTKLSGRGVGGAGASRGVARRRVWRRTVRSIRKRENQHRTGCERREFVRFAFDSVSVSRFCGFSPRITLLKFFMGCCGKMNVFICGGSRVVFLGRDRETVYHKELGVRELSIAKMVT